MDSYLKNYINGQWVDSIGGKRHEVINPATEEPCTEITIGTAADVDAAVKAARAAFESFSQTSVEERIALLGRIVEEFKKRVPDLGKSMAMEMGAPVSFASTAQAYSGISHFGNAIKAGKEPLVSAEAGYRALEFVQAVYRSCREGQKVAIG